MVSRPPNCRSHQRGGMTLAELLVAMSILLVGIYAVARGFPSLFGNLEAERIRTEMVRLMEARLERLKAEPERVPEAIAGHDPDPDTAVVFDPTVLPDEDLDPTEGNARDDLTWVLGETFTVPALRPGYDVSIYPLNLGPAIVQDPSDVAAYLQAYRLERLRRPDMNQQDWETAGRPLEEDQFFLDGAGYLYADPQYESCRVDYAWVDSTGRLHWVQDEVVGNRNFDSAALPVRATDDAKTGLTFANVIAEMARAQASIPYVVDLGQPADVVPNTDMVVLESNYGATLLLPGSSSGEVMHINYQLRTEPDSADRPRRAPIVMEEFPAPTQPPYKLSLGFRGLDDEHPLFENDLLGDPLENPVYALVVDLLTGATWTDAETWIDLDMVEGTLTLDWSHTDAPMIAAHAAGHDLRVYYRTLDGNQITVEKAPAYFIERPIMQTYVDSDPDLDESDRVDFRYYEVRPDSDDPTYTRLVFPASAAGQAVSVDYVVGALTTGRFDIEQRISGELHVVDPSTLAITLDQRPRDPSAGALAVVRVQGVSLTVKGWWHNTRGRVQMMAIDTYLTPKPLL